MIKLLNLLTSSSRRLYGFAFLIRLALIAYGHWQDNNCKYYNKLVAILMMLY